MNLAGSVWQKQVIEEYKDAIKDELDASHDPKRPNLRLQHAIEKIRDLEDHADSENRLKRYIYIVSALVHHQKFGGLTPKEVKTLSKLALAILKIQGIKMVSSKLGYLYGEVYLVLSQIYRRQGEYWRAAWGQQMAAHISQRASSRVKPLHVLSSAISSLRLGHGELALLDFDEALKGSCDRNTKARALLGKMKAIRLSGKIDEAQTFIAYLKREKFWTPNEVREVAWEQMCCEAIISGDISPLMGSVLKGKKHHHYSYILEAFFWSRAVSNRNWMTRYRSAKSMARNRALNPKSEGFFYVCAQSLEQCYDYDIPFVIRLENLGMAVARSRELNTIDKELLLLAATVRWLVRSKSHQLARLVLCEYQSICRKLSDGRLSDVFNVISDLEIKNWFNRSSQKKAA